LEGTDNIVKQKKTKLGKFEMQLLAYAKMNPISSLLRHSIASR